VLLTAMMKRMGMARSLMLTLFIAFIVMSLTGMVRKAPAWLGVWWGVRLLVISAQAGLNSLVASSYPSSIRSTAIGWAGGIGRVTSMIGPGLGGAMLAAGWGSWRIYPAVASPLLLAAIAMMVFHTLRSDGIPDTRD
jgi:AAHS family 4-hydroxybenzoate transporter-like MFS transporter